MNYPYNYLHTATEELEVDDRCNCCIHIIDILGRHFCLVIQTILGETSVIEYGPIDPEIDKLPPIINYTYNRFDCNVKRIDKIIEKFLSTNIHEVELVDISQIKSIIKNPIDYIKA